MLKLIYSAYRDTLRLLVKKPWVILLLIAFILIDIRLTTAEAGLERGGETYDLIFLLSLLISWTLNIFIFWLVFRSADITGATLSEWFKKYYPRSLLQFIGGFFLFLPFYFVLWVMYGEEGLKLQPGHSILMFSMSVWMYIAITIGTLWLCFRNEGFLQNIKNAIRDVFQNFGYYLTLRLVILAFIYLSVLAEKQFVTFNGLVCGLLVILSVLNNVNWIAFVFGFLALRVREKSNVILTTLEEEKNHVP
jgi:hypothetical protein